MSEHYSLFLESFGCAGSADCDAAEHVHGCFSDNGDCDVPDEHDWPDSVPIGLVSDD